MVLSMKTVVGGLTANSANCTNMNFCPDTDNGGDCRNYGNCSSSINGGDCKHIVPTPPPRVAQICGTGGL